MPEAIRKGGLLGANMTAAVAFMKGSCHLSYTTIRQYFKEMMNLDLSRGMLCKAAQKISDALKPAYDQLAIACRMNRRSMWMRPAIMTREIAQDLVFDTSLTACLRSIPRGAVPCLKPCWGGTLRDNRR
jgi:predicted transcriptional regulator